MCEKGVRGNERPPWWGRPNQPMTTNDQFPTKAVLLMGSAYLAIILSASFLWTGCGLALKQWAASVTQEARP